MSLIADITMALSNMRIMIHSMNTRTLKDSTALVYLNISVNSTEHLNSVVARLKKVDGVLDVTRANI